MIKSSIKTVKVLYTYSLCVYVLFVVNVCCMLSTFLNYRYINLHTTIELFLYVQFLWESYLEINFDLIFPPIKLLCKNGEVDDWMTNVMKIKAPCLHQTIDPSLFCCCVCSCIFFNWLSTKLSWPPSLFLRLTPPTYHCSKSEKKFLYTRPGFPWTWPGLGNVVLHRGM